MNRDQEFFDRAGAQRDQAYKHGLVQNTAPTLRPSALGQPGQPMMPDTTGARRWAANRDVFWGASETYDALPAGLYRCQITEHTGPVLIKQNTETDHLLELPDDASTSIVREFGKFWELGEQFRSRGFLHKRGFLLWGPPGSGKTSCVHILIKRLIREQGGIVLFLDQPQVAAACLRMVRTIEPKRPIVAIMEDIDALIANYGEHEYLALLDGEAQVDNIVFLASTNYPERLDRRFVDRPSRFDTIRYIGMPSSAARRVYLATKEPSLAGEELAAWVNASEGFSVAHLKEMIIAVRCFEQPLKDVVARLELMQERKPTSEDTPERKQAGFLGRVKSNGHTHYHEANAAFDEIAF